jgi:hypothetical protein
MPWSGYLAAFVAGAFLVNGVPHFVQGICGNRFQTPFASPPGIGESSALVNVLWGACNFAVGGGLVHYFFPPVFPPPLSLCVIAGISGLITAIWLSHHFARVRNAAPHP